MKKLSLLLLLAGLLTGCETLPFELQTRTDRAAMNEDQLIAQESQRRMAGRLETLELQVNQMNRDMDAMRSQLETRCATIERKSEADKKEMVSKLSGELDKLIKQTAAPAKPATAVPSRGIEHVVRPGETLYIISKAYNISAKTILDANKISDASKLSVGQKLFIPDAK